MFIELDLHPIDQPRPVWVPAPVRRAAGEQQHGSLRAGGREELSEYQLWRPSASAPQYHALTIPPTVLEGRSGQCARSGVR